MKDRTISVILAGGIGLRLHPLTADRAKPEVPFGGRYRIIDFTLSNCLHSGLRRILVLTQYKSYSLQRHLRDCWSIFNSMLASGSVVTGGSVLHSILFPSTRVDEGVCVEESLLFQGVVVGAGAHLRKCVVNKHVVVPAGERIGFDPAFDSQRFTVSEGGIVVIPKGYRFTSAD